jgi:hypothetical protein
MVGSVVDMEIVSTTGAALPVARRRYVESSAMVVDVSNLSSGVYTLVIRSASQNYVVPLAVSR